jgi:hypothetical protein
VVRNQRVEHQLVDHPVNLALVEMQKRVVALAVVAAAGGAAEVVLRTIQVIAITMTMAVVVEALILTRL